MLTNAEHPTAEQIHTRVKAQFPMTSLATVYNTLDLLKEMGALLEIELGHGSSRFDGVNPHPHPHLICTRCHTILDTDIPHLQTVTDVVSQTTGFMVTGYRFDIFGICPTCQTIG